tara:strand:+ start:1081 stop:1419 length:339 start_codon:yes stop_codon:yes gene_type:complete
MSLAKEINEKLDAILFIRNEAKRMDHDLDDDQVLNNIQTGEKTNKAQALEIVEDMINNVKNELNQITNNGLNVKNIFNNKFYINDFTQDKICADIEMNNSLNNQQPNNIELN